MKALPNKIRCYQAKFATISYRLTDSVFTCVYYVKQVGNPAQWTALSSWWSKMVRGHVRRYGLIETWLLPKKLPRVDCYSGSSEPPYLGDCIRKGQPMFDCMWWFMITWRQLLRANNLPLMFDCLKVVDDNNNDHHGWLWWESTALTCDIDSEKGIMSGGEDEKDNNRTNKWSKEGKWTGCKDGSI